MKEEHYEHESGEDGRCPAEYVATLRREAAERRVAAREAEEATTAANARLEALSERLLALEVAVATQGVLADPTDLLANVDHAELRGDDGSPDPDKITAAATSLVERKPHLVARTAPTGEVDQGARLPAAPMFDFADALRRAAG